MHRAKYSEARILFVEPDNGRRKVIETLLINKNNTIARVDFSRKNFNLLVFKLTRKLNVYIL